MRLSRLFLLTGLVLSSASCAVRLPRPAAEAGAAAVPLWQIPPSSLGTQRLYRATYSGPEGEGSFRITLRLLSSERYQVQASDPLGRTLWSLDVAAGGGRWLDHRNRVTCAFTGALDLSGLSLGPFPLVSLPALLLDRLPAAPEGAVETTGRELRFRDASGRSWSAAEAADGGLASWSLGAEGGSTVWWTHREGWSILSDRARKAQVRWSEVTAEKLVREPPPIIPPADFKEEPCEAASRLGAS